MVPMNLHRIISIVVTNGRRRRRRGSSCPKLQSFSAISLRETEGVPKACESRITLVAAPTPMATRTSKPVIWMVLIHLRALICRYQTPTPKKMHWPVITAIVPAMEMPALGGAPCDGSSHAHEIGSVGAMFFITDMRTKIPETHDKTRLMNMRNWRSQRRTQSRLKSLTRASRVEMWVAVDSSDSIQMMKKW